MTTKDKPMAAPCCLGNLGRVALKAVPTPVTGQDWLFYFHPPVRTFLAAIVIKLRQCKLAAPLAICYSTEIAIAGNCKERLAAFPRAERMLPPV